MIPANYWWPQKMSITKTCLPPVLLPVLKEDQGRCAPPLQLTHSQIRSPLLQNGLTLLTAPHPEH